MTVAVCLECGRMKAGAWTACTTCGYQPSGAEELAKALMVSDSCVARDKLEEFATRRQQGEPWNFSPELVATFKAQVAAIIPMAPDGRPARSRDGVPEQSPEPPPTQHKEAKTVRKRWWQFWR